MTIPADENLRTVAESGRACDPGDSTLPEADDADPCKDRDSGTLTQPSVPHDAVSEMIRLFEESLRAGLRPHIEEHLAMLAPPFRDRAFPALLRLELESQADGDEPLFIFRQQYFERFPDRKTIIEQLISEMEARGTTVSLTDDATRPVETFDSSSGSARPLDPDAAAACPKTIGRFRILQELGAGTNGRVFLAHDPKLDREVAIKVPHPDRLKSQRDIERFLHATRAAAQLRHENICPIYEINDVPGEYFLVMAYIKGKSLSHYLAGDRALPIRQSVLLTRQIALAMTEPHQKGILHRDLKPDNIQFDEQRRQPVIMDFGLAHFEIPNSPRLTHDGQLLGTPYYMSPEQAVGHSEDVGPAADLYSLGVMLYQMLTGQRPITGRTVGEVLRNIHTQEPIPPGQHRAEIDQKLNDLCLKAIAKRSQDRFASMSEFANRLTNYLKSRDG